MVDEEIGFRLAVKNRREAQRDINQVGDELDRTGDKAHRVGREARYGAAGLLTLGKSGRVAGRAVLYGTGAMAAGVVGLGIVTAKFTKDSVKGWEDHTKVVRQSRAVIKSTGGAANLTARQVGRLSDALERKTGVDGDVIQSGANMLLTFKNVRNEQGKGNKIFSQSLGVLNDYAAAMHTDASKSAIQMGKALNDPIKGITALAKVGVTFSDGQKDQIKNYVEQGKMASAQKIILRELTSEFGGSAKAQMTTGDQVMVGYHQLQDTIGKAVIPLQQKFNRFLITDALPTAQRYAEVFEQRGVPAIAKYAGIFERRGIPAIKDFLHEAKPVAESILPAIGTGFSTIADTTKVIAPRLKSIFDGFNGLPDWAKQAIVIGAGGAAIGKKLGAGSLLGKGGLLGGVASMAKPLPVVVTNPGFGGGVGGGGFGGAGGKVGGKLPGGAFLPGLLTTVGLAAGVTYGSKDSHAGDHANPGPVGSEADFKRMVAEKNAYTDWWETATKATRGINEHTRGVIAGIDQVDSRVGRARNSTQQLLNVLTGVDTNWRPNLEVIGLDSSLSKANSLRTTLLGLPSLGSYGNGLGVLAASGGPRKPHKGGKGSVAPRMAFPSVEQPSISDDYFGRTGSAGQSIEVPVYLDKREIARAVYDDMETRMANQ